MALIAMAVHDTVENKRSDYTWKTLRSIWKTVNLDKHRFFIIDNGSCEETKTFLEANKSDDVCGYTIITNSENIGTAEAINLAWNQRLPGENCIKMDNDVTTKYIGWVEEMEEVIRRDATIGQVGLKRKDCWENPEHADPFYKSELLMLPHQPGERWVVVEKCNHIMGTCQMYSSNLLDKIGYLYQPKVYGFDDSLASLRSTLAGFKNVFLPHIEIEHIDAGDTLYQKWKEAHASECWGEYHKCVAGYKNGTLSIYYNPFEK